MYTSIIRNLPEDLRLPMLELVETVEQTMRAELTVRREDIESLQDIVREVAESQYRVDQRSDRLETALADLAEAQGRTEQRVEELAQAQARTEQRVEELAEAQKRSEQRLDRLETAVIELTEAQKQSEQRLSRLEVVVTELAEAQKRTDQQLAELVETVKALTARMDRVETKLDRMATRLDRVDGDRLERRYREKAYGYFGIVLRRARPVNFTDIEEMLEDRLTATEVGELRLLDLIVRGRPRTRPDLEELWLAVEVSVTVDGRDVQRAQRRAELLRKAGLWALPVAAGENQTKRARVSAADLGVVVVHDGTIENWDEALAATLATRV